MSVLKERKLLRLKNYDYSRNNFYFITTCCKNRENFFCEIENGKIILNSIGNILEKQWLWLQKQYSYVFLDDFVIMPNHFHGILIIDFLNNVENKNVVNGRDHSLQNHKTKPLSELIGAFKTTSSKLIHNLADEKHVGLQQYNLYKKFQWQKSFYDRIIRNEGELANIRNYIKNNPLKWQFDIENVVNGSDHSLQETTVNLGKLK